jgi:hypothetical protein
MVQVVVSELPCESTTFDVNVYVPGVVLLPLIVPVAVFRLSPGGSEPPTIENV